MRYIQQLSFFVDQWIFGKGVDIDGKQKSDNIVFERTETRLFQDGILIHEIYLSTNITLVGGTANRARKMDSILPDDFGIVDQLSHTQQRIWNTNLIETRPLNIETGGGCIPGIAARLIQPYTNFVMRVLTTLPPPAQEKKEKLLEETWGDQWDGQEPTSYEWRREEPKSKRKQRLNHQIN